MRIGFRRPRVLDRARTFFSVLLAEGGAVSAEKATSQTYMSCVYPGCDQDLSAKAGFFLCSASSCRRAQFSCPVCQANNRVFVRYCTGCGEELRWEEEVLHARETFRIGLELSQVLADSGLCFRLPLARPQRFPPTVSNGYLLLCTYEERSAGERGGFRLVMVDPESGEVVREFPLPAYLIDRSQVRGRREMLFATPKEVLTLDTESMTLSTFLSSPGKTAEFVHEPVYADSWYLAVKYNERSAFGLYRLDAEKQALQEVAELPGEPLFMTENHGDLAVLCSEGGLKVNREGTTPLPVAEAPPREEACAGLAVCCNRDLIYVTDRSLAVVNLDRAERDDLLNVRHSGRGMIVASAGHLLIADTDGLRSTRLSDVRLGAEPAVVARGMYSDPPCAFGIYAAVVAGEETLQIFDVVLHEEIQRRRLERVLCAPFFFDGRLYVLAGFLDSPQGELLAFDLAGQRT